MAIPHRCRILNMLCSIPLGDRANQEVLDVKNRQ